MEIKNKMQQNEAFDKYFLILKEWNKKINLVQSETLDNYFSRHIKDSLQIIPFLDFNSKIIDVGTGAGFPGVPLAISGFRDVLLCDKNFKKFVFLKYIREKLNLKYQVFNDDIFNLNVSRETSSNCIVVSRAFASLLKLMQFMNAKDLHKGVFHKGENYMTEIDEAKRVYDFDYTLKPSVTNPNSAIVIIGNIREKQWQ